MTYRAPVRDLAFSLRYAADFGKLAEVFPEADADTVAAVLEAAGAFAADVLAPLNRGGDLVGAKLENGVVRTAPGFADAYKQFAEGGWASLAAPVAHGGQGLPKTLEVAVLEMIQASNMAFGLCPMLSLGAIEALELCGSDSQKHTYLPRLVSGEWTGTMNLTEPQAGSDLAALTTLATPDGDGGWRITGQKIWTTGAQFSAWGALLARTDPSAPKHQGITYFLLDMKSEGVEVKPLRELTGNAMFNTVFIDDVFVPDDMVLGEVDRGWEVSRNTLTNERVSIGSSEPPFLASLDQFVEFVRDGHFDQIEQNEAGRLIAEGHAAKLLNMRSTLLTLAGGDPMPAAAISKLLSMKTGQGYAEFGVSSFGTDAAIGDQGQLSGKWAEYLLAGRATTIYGGTSEVQLNIIAERLLGLPRDP